MPLASLFYALMRFVYAKAFGRQYMLHYPLYRHDDQDLMQGQTYFTEYCVAQIPALRGLRLLDVGCGNGVQTMHIHEHYRPALTQGVDLDPAHIEYARAEGQKRDLKGIEFTVDNAQSLRAVNDSSFDVVICIESAHHYPDKQAFLAQAARALRPGGYLLVADLLCRKERPARWFDRHLSLFYWSADRYQSVLPRVGFELLSGENITPLLLSGFSTSRNWFRASSHGAGYWIARIVGEFLVRLYIHQLTHDLDYHLMLARKV